jgi:nucleotidyltransferase/DNA polymerase involved in DNA repair
MEDSESRIIFHVDLDCFYAAVERLTHPEYVGCPLVVGADPKKGKGRGVVLTSSYEARKFGIRSGMPISEAYRLCPSALYVPPHFEAYSIASHQVMNILRKFSEQFQQTGSDEGYLDMSDYCANFQDAFQIASQIQQEIFQKTRLTVSIGVASTKSLAKIATDIKKPNGITIIESDKISEILGPLDIDKVPGIGKKSKDQYLRKGYKIIQNFIDSPLRTLKNDFGQWGEWIWAVVHGIDNRPVLEWGEQKSSSEERTFGEDVSDVDKLLTTMNRLYDQVDQSMRDGGTSYRTITLKIRFQGFQTYTRSKSWSSPIDDVNLGKQILKKLFDEFLPLPKKVRLLGVKLSNFQEKENCIQETLESFI